MFLQFFFAFPNFKHTLTYSGHFDFRTAIRAQDAWIWYFDLNVSLFFSRLSAIIIFFAAWFFSYFFLLSSIFRFDRNVYQTNPKILRVLIWKLDACAHVCVCVCYLYTRYIQSLVVTQILEYVMFVSRSVYAPGHTFNNILNIRFVQIVFRFACLSPSPSLLLWIRFYLIAFRCRSIGNRVRSVRIRTSYVHGRNQKSFFSTCKMKITSNFRT